MTANDVFSRVIRDSEPLVQLLIFAAVTSGLWLAEWRVAPAGKLRRAGINAVFILTALPIQFFMTLACFALSKWTAEARWGLVYCFPGADDPAIKYGVMFFALDFLDYVYHRAMHFVPLFWRFHLLHHSDLTVDVSTTTREHPGETFIRNGFLILWVFISGASIEILVLRQMAESVANIFAHTSLRLPDRLARILGWLIITPNSHHAHHHFRRPATDRNFGDIFSIWDRFFGTFIVLPRQEIVFGIDTHIDGRIDARLTGGVARLRAFASAIARKLEWRKRQQA
jgi:sterol desaturase/sphingolipid hydroxylase (fatty acid hydroxylase superfamily)